MANQVEEKLVLGGKERTIRMDLSALAAIEDETGENVFDTEFWTGISAKKLQIILWACMRNGEDASVTPDTVGSWIELSQFREITTKVMRMWADAMPEGTAQEVYDALNGPSPKGRAARRHGG